MLDPVSIIFASSAYRINLAVGRIFRISYRINLAVGGIFGITK